MATAVITGANRGIGLEFTRQYLADGWRVIALLRESSEELDALADDGSLRIITAELTDDDSLRAAVDSIDEERIDLLINNAGMMGDGVDTHTGRVFQPFGHFNRDEWQQVFDINTFTPMALSELLVEKLRAAEKPVIATISSQLGSIANDLSGGMYAYRASKAAVNAIMKALSINLKDDGIVCLSLHPGWVKTDMGGPNAEVPVRMSVSGMRNVIARATLARSGDFIAYDGRKLLY